jgi:hypothetical protein
MEKGKVISGARPVLNEPDPAGCCFAGNRSAAIAGATLRPQTNLEAIRSRPTVFLATAANTIRRYALPVTVKVNSYRVCMLRHRGRQAYYACTSLVFAGS